MSRLTSRLTLERRLVVDFVHIFGLCAFALAQPLYDLLGKNPTFFVAHRAEGLDILFVVAVLSVGVPLALVVLEYGIQIVSENARRVAHLALVALLLTFSVLSILTRMLDVPTLAMLIIATGTSGVITGLYATWQPVRTFAGIAAAGAIVFPAYFLVFTPVNGLLVGEETTKGRVEISNPVPVVIVVFDEFNTTALLDQDGQIDSGRFPNFAAFGAGSWWYPNAVASHVTTALAVPAILTGQMPQPVEKRSPIASDYPNNLFILLGESYKLNVAEAVTRLCPKKLCGSEPRRFVASALFGDLATVYLHLVAPPALARDLPPLDTGWTGFGRALLGERDTDGSRGVQEVRRGVNERDRQLEDFLQRLDDEPSHQLNFLHVELPHMPYEYLSTGHVYNLSSTFEAIEGFNGEARGWANSEPLVRLAYQRYLHQVAYLDRFMGRLMDRLRDLDLYDQALIVVTADHGVAFRPGLSRRWVQGDNVSDVLKVPMFIKLPGQKEGGVNLKFVSGLDVIPTVAHVLGVQVPWTVHGISMIADDSERGGRDLEIGGVGRFDRQQLRGFPRLEWQQQAFGSRTPLDSLPIKGPYENLIGKEVGGLRIGKPSGFAAVADLKPFGDVNPASDFLPAMLRGHLLKANGPVPLALALNDRIWATTTTVEWANKQAYFAIMFPPAAFQPGRNMVSIFAIHETESGLSLLPVPTNDGGGVAIRRLKDGTAETDVLVYEDGRAIPVNATWDMVRATVDRVSIRESTVIIEGWAADIVKKVPVQAVHFFLNDRLLATVSTGIATPGVADEYKGEGLLYSGYSAQIPVELIKDGAGQVRMFAVAHSGRAFEHLKVAERLRAAFADQQRVRSVPLQRDENGILSIEYPDGRRIPVDANWEMIRGNIDRVASRDGFLIVDGWAADMASLEPVAEVLFFDDTRPLVSVTPTNPRQDVVEHYRKDSLLYTGFSAEIPVNKISSKVDAVRVFLVSKERRALELRFTGLAEKQLHAALRAR